MLANIRLVLAFVPILTSLASASPVLSPPQPVRGQFGAPILGPQNGPLQIQNPSLLAPPSTDHGDVPNIKWPFSLSHSKLSKGGWARQQNVQALPIATELAGVNMRLKPGAVRELHWHNTAEWAYMLKGDVRISIVTPEGKVYVGDVTEGDLWYFPAGFPHYLQAKNSTAASSGYGAHASSDPDEGGAEFLLVFDSGSFSEDSTFQLTDWLAHTPKDVLAKNFGIVSEEIKTQLDRIPKDELYIFPTLAPPADPAGDMVIPNNTPLPYTFPLSKMKAIETSGGRVKVADTRTFEVSTTISAAEVEVDVGGLRELHWHPTEPEWTFFISGQARVTMFASTAQARTFDFSAGDIAYIPPSFGHYVENTGNTPLKFLEIFRGSVYQDISLTQWLALTTPSLIKAHLGFEDNLIATLRRTKQIVVAGPSA